METKFTLEENAGLNPSIITYLKSIPIGGFSYQYYKLRHPGAIYNLMASKLVDSISFLCKEINERRTDNLKNGFRLVLHDFFQFYESCYEIMLCFCKEHNLPSDKDFLHIWLKKNNYFIGENFHKSVWGHIKDLKYHHNELKHSSNDIQFIMFKNRSEITVGYFLDMPRESYKNPLDPISLNRELKRMYFLIYFISEKLKDALILHLKQIYQFDLLPSVETIKDDTFKKLNQSIHSLSDFYLLNEIGKGVWESVIKADFISFQRKIINENLVSFYVNGMNLHMYVTHDGYNNSYLVPFCGLQQLGLKMYYLSQNQQLIELPIISW